MAETEKHERPAARTNEAARRIDILCLIISAAFHIIGGLVTFGAKAAVPLRTTHAP